MGTRRARLLAAVSVSVLACAVAAPAAQAAATPAGGAEHVVLKPRDRAGWSPSQLFSTLRPDYHEDRTLAIDTTPPGATLDLFYVRASFQKRYEQAQAPVVVELPTRAEAGSRDSVTIRAYLPGHKIATAHVPVRSGQDHLLIELDPLPNALVAVSHTYFAGREGLSLLLKQPAGVRVQKAERGFSLILPETANQPAAEAVLAGLHSPYIANAEAQQLGEDLLIRVSLAPGVDADALELRSREQEDAVRGLHAFILDLTQRGQAAKGVQEARDALARIGSGDVSGCAASFDRTLRSRLDREQLSRALEPRNDFTDPYLRAALRRLGEVSPGGVIHMEDGTAYRPGVPLELAAAASQAAGALGYLALLHEWVRLLEPAPYRPEALRSLVAPEMDPDAFAKALSAAEAAERSCRGTSAAAGRSEGRS